MSTATVLVWMAIVLQAMCWSGIQITITICSRMLDSRTAHSLENAHVKSLWWIMSDQVLDTLEAMHRSRSFYDIDKVVTYTMLQWNSNPYWGLVRVRSVFMSFNEDRNSSTGIVIDLVSSSHDQQSISDAWTFKKLYGLTCQRMWNDLWKKWLFAYNKPFDWFGRVDTTKMSISFFLLTSQQKKANWRFCCIYPVKPNGKFIVSE